MKKTFLRYLFTIIVSVSIIIVLLIGGYSFLTIDRFIKDNRTDIFKQIESRTNQLYTMFKIIEQEINKIGTANIVKISEELSKFEYLKDIPADTLTKIAEKYNVDDIYIINSEGIVFNTTFAPDFGFNLNNIGPEFTDFFKSIYGRGVPVTRRFDVSKQTGKIQKYIYFSPHRSDHIIEISYNIKKYLTEKYSQEYFNFLFKEHFLELVSLNKYLQSLDIYHFSNVSAWSIITEGKKLYREREILELLSEGEELTIQENGELVFYKQIDSQGESFGSFDRFVLELRYDFSLLNEFRAKVLLYTLLLMIIIILTVYLISSKILSKHFLERIIEIDKGISEIEHGHYNLNLKVKGDDEISNIAEHINKMGSEIRKRTNDLINLEQKNSVLAMTVTAHHEINQPLMTMYGYLEMLKNTMPLEHMTEKQKKYLIQIRESMEKIHSILEKYKKGKTIHFEKYLNDSMMVVFDLKKKKKDDSKE